MLASNATQCGMLADMQRGRFRQCECMAERQSAKGRARKFGLTHILLRGWRVRLHDYLHAFLSRFWSVGRSSEGAVSLQVGQGYKLHLLNQLEVSVTRQAVTVDPFSKTEWQRTPRSRQIAYPAKRSAEPWVQVVKCVHGPQAHKHPPDDRHW